MFKRKVEKIFSEDAIQGTDIYCAAFSLDDIYLTKLLEMDFISAVFYVFWN